MSQVTACLKCKTKDKCYRKACECEQETREKNIPGLQVREETSLEQDLKQKQIEEMADCQSCYNSLGTCPIKVKTNCVTYREAMRQYERGLRKITEENVVLPKKVYELLKIQQQEKHWVNASMIVCEIAKIEEREATVNKFAEMIIEEHGGNPSTNEGDEDIKMCLTVSELHEICNKILEDKNL